jgi:hypothetical protein
MFDESEETYGEARKELLADGEFLYSADDVLKGYEVFRKRYVNKQTATKLVIGFIALGSSIFMVFTEPSKTLPIICAAVCAVCIAWFIKTPIENKKKTKEAVTMLSGDRYKAEIYADAARIILLEESADNENGESESGETGSGDSSETDNLQKANAAADAADAAADPPTTIIHLDQYVADFLSAETLYIIVVAKRYVFVIPKSAFSEEGQARIEERLPLFLDSRYKTIK